MTARFAAHNPPDVFYVDSSVAPDWVAQGVLAPLDSTSSRRSTTPTAVLPEPAERLQGQGKNYGLPKDWSPLAMEVDTVALLKAGMRADDLGPADRRGQKMQAEVVPGGKPICLSADWARLLPFVFQNGGSLAASTSPAATAAAKKASTSTSAWSLGLARTPDKLGSGWCGEALGKQKAAIIFEGNWVLPYMKSTRTRTSSTAIYAMIRNKAGGNLGFTVSYSMAKDSKNKTAAWTLLSWLTGQAGQKLWVSKGLALPSRSDVKAIGGRQAFLSAAPDSRAGASRNFSNVYTVMNNDLSAVIPGEEAVSAMLKDIQTRPEALKQ